MKTPKAELHCHIEGATPPALAARLAAKYGVDLSAWLKDGRYVWHDFSSFIACYAAIANVFRAEEDFADLAETYLGALAADGAIYSELFVSPEQGLTVVRLGKTPDEGRQAARDQLGRIVNLFPVR